MADVIIFTLKQVISFIDALRSVYILGANFSLFSLFVSIVAVRLIYNFILRFFKVPGPKGEKKVVINTDTATIHSRINKFRYRTKL